METAAGRFPRLFFTLEVALAAARSAAVALDVTANTCVREMVCHVMQLPQDTQESVWPQQTQQSHAAQAGARGDGGG